MKYNGSRTSVDDAIKRINEQKKTGYRIRMCTNPYNNLVIRLDFVDDSVNPPDFDTIWLEQLTHKTEDQLLTVADETHHGRLW